MKLANLALVSATLLALVAVGCKNDDDADDTSSNDTLGTAESQLVEDDAEATDTDEDLESGVDEPLSGGTATDPGTPADGASDDEVLEKVRTNAGKFFQPAGCITSTRDGNKITHVFAGCKGPLGLRSFDGTIVSTYVRADGKLTITHEANGFKSNGATITGSRVIEYTRNGTVITRKRTGTWSGTTGKGKEISHTANFTATWDASTKCITRDGSAQTTIGGRELSRTVTGYKRCGIGSLGCPQSGTIVLTRTKGENTATLTLSFPGGATVNVTKPNGKQVTRPLACNANAT